MLAARSLGIQTNALTYCSSRNQSTLRARDTVHHLALVMHAPCSSSTALRLANHWFELLKQFVRRQAKRGTYVLNTNGNKTIVSNKQFCCVFNDRPEWQIEQEWWHFFVCHITDQTLSGACQLIGSISPGWMLSVIEIAGCLTFLGYVCLHSVSHAWPWSLQARLRACKQLEEHWPRCATFPLRLYLLLIAICTWMVGQLFWSALLDHVLY